VCVEFHRPGFAVLCACHYLQASRGQVGLVFRVDLVIAEELLDHLVATIYPVQKRALLQAYAGNWTAELGIGWAALGHRTNYGRNDDVFGLKIVFGAVSIGEFQDIAGTL
jgi:hypothetical protein